MRGVTTRDAAIGAAVTYFDGGGFLGDLRRQVAYRTESGVAERREDLRAYLEEELVPAARELGATAAVYDNPDPRGGPLLVATRQEDAALLTVLTWGTPTWSQPSRSAGATVSTRGG